MNKFETYRAHFENILQDACAAMEYRPHILGESMQYSLLVGGKRIRPVLFFAALDLFGADWKEEKDLALALECIHTYSLIHDDLPAMDNDDFRRGKPSNHKRFGEANAILAGDALLSYACERMLFASQRDEAHLRAAMRLAKAAGAEGMIAGQSADLLCTGKEAGEDELFYMYKKKTGELLTAPIVMAAILTGEDVTAAENFGEALGILFQLTDDILDETGSAEALGKTPGKDREENKLTCIRVFGLEKSQKLADEYLHRCEKILDTLKGDTDFFRELILKIRGREM